MTTLRSAAAYVLYMQGSAFCISDRHMQLRLFQPTQGTRDSNAHVSGWCYALGTATQVLNRDFRTNNRYQLGVGENSSHLTFPEFERRTLGGGGGVRWCDGTLVESTE